MEGTPRSPMPATSILLADDDERFRAIVRDVLEDDGYTVVAEAGDAADVGDLDREHRPDVIVLDLVMTGAHGLNTARQLVAADRNRPVVVISSLFDPVVEQEVVRLGAWYLEKVEGIEALEHLIDDAVSITQQR